MSRINVDIGDIVHEGQTLAVLEVPELKAELQQTVFQLQQTKEEITRAQHEIYRAEAEHAALHAASERLKQAAAGRPGLIAQQELDDAEAKDLSSEAQVDAAKSRCGGTGTHRRSAVRQSARRGAAQLHQCHSASGWSCDLAIRDTGALIQGGTNSNDQALPIVRISQSNLLRLRIPVPEDDVRYVHVGDQLQVR